MSFSLTCLCGRNTLLPQIVYYILIDRKPLTSMRFINTPIEDYLENVIQLHRCRYTKTVQGVSVIGGVRMSLMRVSQGVMFTSYFRHPVCVCIF